jgi:hypothetical protein
MKTELIGEGKYDEYGSRIRQDILKEKRVRYGEDLLPTLSAKLVREFGRGFTEKNLRRMVQFAEVFSDMEIVVTMSRQLSWSHFVAILPLKDDLQRDFYAEMCMISSVTSTPKCAGWNGGVFEHCGKKLMECFMNAPPYQRSLRN